MTLKFSSSDTAFIQQLPVSRIATATKTGEPRVRPVWHVFDGKCIYFATDPETVKLSHIGQNPRVSIVFDDYDQNNWSNLRGIRVQGIAEIILRGEEYRHAHALLKGKYPEYRTQSGGWEEGEIPIIKVTPQSVGKWANADWKEKAAETEAE